MQMKLAFYGWKGGSLGAGYLMRMNLQDIYQERELVLVVIKIGLILLGIKLGLIFVGV